MIALYSIWLFMGLLLYILYVLGSHTEPANKWDVPMYSHHLGSQLSS